MEDLQTRLRRTGFGLWRQRWLAIAIAWVLCIAGWFAVAAIPDQYEATARIHVDADAALTPRDDAAANQRDVLLRTALSRPNLEQLAARTGLDRRIADPADRERMLQALADGIRLSPQAGNLLAISARSGSARQAYAVVQQLLTILIENKAGASHVEQQSAAQRLEQQIAQAEQQLQLADARRAEFRARYLDLLPSDDSGLSRLDVARTTVSQLEQRLKDATLRRDMLKQQLDLMPATFRPDPQGGGAGDGVNPAIAEAERHLRELRLRYTEQHPDVVAARALLASLKANPPPIPADPRAAAAQPGAAGGRGVANPIYDQLRLQLLDAEGQVALLQRQLDDETRERDRLASIARGAPGLEAEYTDMNRDYDGLRKNHADLVAQREAARLATASEAERVRLDVVEPPLLPQRPVAPSRALLDSAVLALGLAGGIGVAFLLQQCDSSFQTADEMRRLDLPVAGSITLLATSVPLYRRLLGVGSVAVAILLLCAVWGGLMVKMLREGLA